MDFLKPADLPENFTRSLYKIAPYRGCGHGCRYCDGRAERYYVEGDFEKDVLIRKDIPMRLERDLPLVRERGMVAFGSGTTDPYQPLEAKERISGRCAELLAAEPPSGLALPAMVMTKSALALRDLELWRRVNEKAGFLLMVSLTSLDEDLRLHMEPGASSFAERLSLLKAFKAAGCATGILAMPFLPGLSDSEESIRALYTAAIEANVDFIMPGGLTLRPGRQKDLYLATLADYRPDLLEATRFLFKDERPSGWPGAEATRDLMSRIAPIQKDSGIPWLLPHAVYERILPQHDALRILFLDMLELYKDRGVPTGPLKLSAKAYDAWLLAKRREFRRKRSLPPSWLEESLPEALRTGELATVLNNRKLLDFVTAVVAEGGRLDYRTLKLE
jgi:DNA repair photolyase